MTNEETTADLEQLDTQDQEEVVETQEETQQEETTTEPEKDWKAEALKQKAINERLNKRFSSQETKEPSKKSDDFGYDVKAYLKTSGIQSNEFDFVKSELKQSGLKDVDALLDNDYFKARLEKHRAVVKTTEATPTGKRSGGVPTDSVEYWASKPIEEVPQDMRIKVVNHRLSKDKNKGMFYNS